MGNRRKQKYLENRELSWLKFNGRVLEEAADPSVPLCERMSFLSIFQSNLDEFFMVRVGSLYNQMLADKTAADNKTGMTNKEQLQAVFEAVKALSGRKDSVYLSCMEELKKEGIEWVRYSDMLMEEKLYLDKYFTESILPLLSPQVIGKKQPFPFLKHKEIYAVVLLGGKSSQKLGIIPCSNGLLGRMIELPSEKRRYILIEEVILHYLPKIFKHYTIMSKSLIRIIRNADIDVDEAFYDEDLDYRDSVEKLIRTRKRLCPVKLEYSRVLDVTVIEKLREELGLWKDQVFFRKRRLRCLICLSFRRRCATGESCFTKKEVRDFRRIFARIFP